MLRRLALALLTALLSLTAAVAPAAVQCAFVAPQQTHASDLPVLSVSLELNRALAMAAENARARKLQQDAGDGAVPVLTTRVAEVKGVVLMIFENSKIMNYSLLRASSFIEQKIMRDHSAIHSYSSRVAGHDLKGRDLLTFWQSFQSHESSTHERAEDVELRQTENQFWNETLLPLLHDNPDMVVIAASLDRMPVDVVSHEIIHAQYFRSAKFRDIARLFWKSALDDSQRSFIIRQLEHGYDSSDEDLMINEFTAYMLQRRPDSAMQRPLPHDFIRQFREAFSSAGVPAIEILN